MFRDGDYSKGHALSNQDHGMNADLLTL